MFVLRAHLDLSVLGLDAFIRAHTTKTRPKTCKICGYAAADSRDVGRHIESKHINLEILCRYCGSLFRNRRTLGGHLKARHPETKDDLKTIIYLHVKDLCFDTADIIM